MPKYGRGLNREIVAAVNSGLITEPFSTKDVRKLIKIKKWQPEPTENHINVTLANGASDKHSITFKKYFSSIGDGKYKIKEQYKGEDWLQIMDFQRKGAKSNTHAGKDFEKKVKDFFKNQGIELSQDVTVSIGINKKKKPHKFDLGDVAKKIIVECKSHTQTESGNVPSAKITTWDQAMYYFHVCPQGYRKIFIVLKDYNPKKKETLCDYYLRTKDHLIPDDVEIWELDEPILKGKKKN